MKTIILDFDGTLADTAKSIIRTTQKVARTLGVPELDESKIKSLIGLPLTKSLAILFNLEDGEKLQNAVDLYRDFFKEFATDSVVIYPNVKETLKTLYNNGKTITIASSRGKESLRELLGMLEILEYCSIIIANEDVENKKPAPDMALKILEMTNTHHTEAIVVGDTIFDIEMGQGAGCTTCGVTYGNQCEAQLKEQGADYIFNDFSELLNVVH